MAVKKTLTFDIFGKDKTASKTIKGVGKAADSMGKRLGKIGLGIGAGFAAAAAGLVAFSVDSVKALMRIEELGAQTDAVIESMGASAWTTKDQIVALSDRLEKLTATESEAIQEGANLLLTFGNIRNEAGEGNDIFDRTTELMVDMARAMGTDASGSAIQLGKALNDPIAGISALSRVGITFTDDQKELIKSLVEAGDVMGAQKVILDELQQQFGGSGAAYADTFAGKIDTLKNNVGAAGEAIMLQLMPELEAMIDWINTDGLVVLDEFVAWFKEDAIPAITDLVEWVIKWKDELGLAAAAIGAATTAQWILNGAMAANPIGVVITALILASAWIIHVMSNFDKFRVGVLNAADSVVIGMVNITRGFNGFVEDLVNNMITGINSVIDAVNGVLSAIGMARIGRIGTFNMDNSGLDRMVRNAQGNRTDGVFGGGGGRRATYMATGGIVRPTAGGTNAVIGEAGTAEAVIPLSRSALAKYGLGGGDTYVVNVSGITTHSEAEMGRVFVKAVKAAQDSGLIRKVLPVA